MSTTPTPLPQEADISVPASGEAQASPDFSSIAGHFHVSDHLAQLSKHAQDLAQKIGDWATPDVIKTFSRTPLGKKLVDEQLNPLLEGAKKIATDPHERTQFLVGLVQPGGEVAEGTGVVGEDVKGLVEKLGYDYKGQFAGSKTHQVEHPNHPGKTSTVDEPVTPEDVHAAIKRKLDEFGVDPNVPETVRQFLERKRGTIKDFSTVEGQVERLTPEQAFQREMFQSLSKPAETRGTGPAGVPGLGADIEEPVKPGRQGPLEGSQEAGTFFEKSPIYEGPTGDKIDFGSIQGRKEVRPPKVKKQAEPPTVRGGYYNTIEHVVKNKLGDKFTPEQLEATLKNAGVPKQDIDTSGLNDLTGLGKFTETAKGSQKMISRQEILGHLDRNRLHLDVVTKGSLKFPEEVQKLLDERSKIVVDRDTANRRVAAAERRNVAVRSGQPDPRGSYTFEGPSYRMDQEAIKKADSRLNEIDEQVADWGFSPGEIGEMAEPAKYEQYTLPGGTNYHEVLLQQVKEAPDITPQPGEGYYARRRRIKGEDYFGPHFDEPNVLAHLRLKDRVDTQGRKTLFMEEAQSDWAHDIDEPGRKDTDTPRFPLGRDWHGLALKHALKEAVDGGYDSLSWTTGQQQAERYNLNKVVDHLVYVKNTGALLGYKNGNNVFTHGDVSPEGLSEYVGKDMAQKLLESPSGMDKSWRREAHARGNQIFELKLDKDTTFGGESHKHLYDEMIPQFLNKYTKRWGGKVGTTEVPAVDITKTIQDSGKEMGISGPTISRLTEAASKSGAIKGSLSPEELDELNEIMTDHGVSKKVAQTLIEDLQTKQNVAVHTLPITPELREAVKQGQPMFGMGVKEGAAPAKAEVSKPEARKKWSLAENKEPSVEPLTGEPRTEPGNEPIGSFHYKILDPKGQDTGAEIDGIVVGGNMHIQWIGHHTDPDFAPGPKAMRDVMDQLKANHPKVRTIEWERVSGSHAEKGTTIGPTLTPLKARKQPK